MLENVNIGVCQWRATNGKPSFFVNYTENGENKYAFFKMRFAAEDFKNRLNDNPKQIRPCP